jgi:hypothetical protein
MATVGMRYPTPPKEPAAVVDEILFVAEGAHAAKGRGG